MTRFPLILFASTVLLACPLPSVRAQQPTAKPTVAVLTLDVQHGVTREEAQILADRLAIEMDRTGRFTLINRQRMAEQLEMQKFSLLNNCSSSECAVEAGRILGAANMVYGSIGKIGDTFSINAYLIAVETGATLQSASTDIRGGIEEMLTRGIAECATKLAKERDQQPTSSATVRPTCAVLTFDSRGGISLDEVRLYGDRFAIELDTFKQYILVPRSKMDEVLKLQEFVQTDNCSAAECAVEAGRLLGVRYMIYGSIGKLGQLFTLNTYMVDVETGAAIHTATTDFRGGKEDFLTQGMRGNVMNLLGAQLQEGYLKISLTPPDAQLRVGDKPIRPGIIPVTAGETIKITATAPGHLVYFQTCKAEAGQTLDVNIRLDRAVVPPQGLPSEPPSPSPRRPRVH